MTRPITDPWAEGGLRVWDDYQFRRKGIKGGGPSKVKLRAPYNQVPPVISGMVVTDGVLSCTTGTWGGTPPFTYTYQWFVITTTEGEIESNLSLAGEGELLLHDKIGLFLLVGTGPTEINTTTEAIPGATSSTYVVPASPEGKVYYCQVTATNSVGFAIAFSNTLGFNVDMPPPQTLITDLTGEVHGRDEIWLSWTPIPGSKGTVIYRSRSSGTPPLFTGWEACRVAYPGNSYRDGCEGPLDSGRYYTYQAAAYYDGGEGPLSAPVTYRTDLAFDMGYQALLWCGVPVDGTANGWVSDYTCTYNIASPPAHVEGTGGNVYYFISTQSAFFNIPAGYEMTLLQPVVAYGSYGDADNPVRGGDYWWLANWIIHRNRFYISPAMAVPTGVTTVTAKIVRNGPFDYTSKFVEYPALDNHMTGLDHEAGVPMIGYEYYGFPTDWTDMPGTMILGVTNVSLSIAGTQSVSFNVYRTLSGCQVSIANNFTTSPTITIIPAQNNDWIPVNM